LYQPDSQQSAQAWHFTVKTTDALQCTREESCQQLGVTQVMHANNNNQSPHNPSQNFKASRAQSDKHPCLSCTTT
jgi:hypothetical protein